MAWLGPLLALIVDASTFIAMALVFFSLKENLFFEMAGSSSPGKNLHRPTGRATVSLLKRGLYVIPLATLAYGTILAAYQVEWPRLLSSVDGGLFFALVSLGGVISSAAVYRAKNALLQRGIIVVPTLLLPFLALPPIYANDLVLLASALFLGLIGGLTSTLIYSAVQVQIPTEMRGRMFGIMEPLEKVPLFFVFMALGWFGHYGDIRLSFLACFAFGMVLCAAIAVTFFRFPIAQQASAITR